MEYMSGLSTAVFEVEAASPQLEEFMRSSGASSSSGRLEERIVTTYRVPILIPVDRGYLVGEVGSYPIDRFLDCPVCDRWKLRGLSQADLLQQIFDGAGPIKPIKLRDIVAKVENESGPHKMYVSFMSGSLLG